MRILSGCHKYKYSAGAVLAIGNFDGLHLGHQRLVHYLVRASKLRKTPGVLLTFEPHPAEVLFPLQKNRRIYPLEKLKTLLKGMGVKVLIVEAFTKTFSRLSAENFMAQKINRFIKPSLIVAGSDFRFGAENKGSLSLLSKWGKKSGFQLKVLKPVKIHNRRVSSSLIKECILKGSLQRAFRLLGRPFSFQGQKITGQGLGRKLGFPTINIQTSPRQILPKTGVYRVQVKEKSKLFPAVMNIGLNPTVSSDPLQKIEVHIIHRDIVRRRSSVEVEVLDYLRPEKTFSSLSKLAEQIRRDIKKACKKF